MHAYVQSLRLEVSKAVCHKLRPAVERIPLARYFPCKSRVG